MFYLKTAIYTRYLYLRLIKEFNAINWLYSLIGTPLGYIMQAFYTFFGSFGWSVLAFTAIVKSALFPLTLKQQKNTAKSAVFAPRMKEIQTKYASNKVRQQEEMAKLQQEGYNPFGGCAPMIAIMLVFFGMVDVVYKPLTHFVRMDKDDIALIKEIGLETEVTKLVLTASDEDYNNIVEWLESQDIAVTAKDRSTGVGDNFNITNAQRLIFGEPIVKNISSVANTKKNPAKISKSLSNSIKKLDTNYNKSMQGELHSLRTYEDYPEIFQVALEDDPDLFEKTRKIQQDLYFFGLNLGRVPQMKAQPLIIVPLLACALSFLSLFMGQWTLKKTLPDVYETQQKTPGMKFMLYFSPVFSLWISFTIPAGAGFYWGAGYIFSIVQALVLYKFFPADKMRAKALEEYEKSKDSYKTVVTVEKETDNGEIMTKSVHLSEMSKSAQNDYYKKKLAEARLADQKKYDDPDDNFTVGDIEEPIIEDSDGTPISINDQKSNRKKK